MDLSVLLVLQETTALEELHPLCNVNSTSIVQQEHLAILLVQLSIHHHQGQQNMVTVSHHHVLLAHIGTDHHVPHVPQETIVQVTDHTTHVPTDTLQALERQDQVNVSQDAV